MLAALTRGTLFKVAIWVAALAVFSFVAPPIAVAFSPSKTAAYCLTHVDHAFVHEHDQTDAVQPGVGHHDDHAKHSHGDHKSTCCGLFCVTALAPSVYVFEPAWSGSAVSSALETSFQGRMPDRLDRPPISLLSV